MKCVKVVLGGLMLALAPLAALADDMSYSYVDLGYVETDIDDCPSADGFGVRGSVGFAENWFVFGEYTSQDFSTASTSTSSPSASAATTASPTRWTSWVDSATSTLKLRPAASASASTATWSRQVFADRSPKLRAGRPRDPHRLGDDGGDERPSRSAGRYFFTDQFAFGAEYRHRR